MGILKRNCLFVKIVVATTIILAFEACKDKDNVDLDPPFDFYPMEDAYWTYIDSPRNYTNPPSGVIEYTLAFFDTFYFDGTEDLTTKEIVFNYTSSRDLADTMSEQIKEYKVLRANSKRIKHNWSNLETDTSYIRNAKSGWIRFDTQLKRYYSVKKDPSDGQYYEYLMADFMANAGDDFYDGVILSEYTDNSIYRKHDLELVKQVVNDFTNIYEGVWLKHYTQLWPEDNIEYVGGEPSYFDWKLHFDDKVYP